MTRGAVPWLAGAALYVFLWWVASVIVGSDIASFVFAPVAVVLLAQQCLRRRRRRVTFGNPD